MTVKDFDGYMRAYKEGAVDKKTKLVALVKHMEFPSDWKGYEVRNAILRALESERDPLHGEH